MYVCPKEIISDLLVHGPILESTLVCSEPKTKIDKLMFIVNYVLLHCYKSVILLRGRNMPSLSRIVK